MSQFSFHARVVLFLLGQVLICWPCAAQAQQGVLTDFLFFLERLPSAPECTIALKSSGEPAQVTILTPDGRKKSFFVEVGKPFFSGGRFTPTKFEKKIVTGADGTEKDLSQLTVLDNLRKTPLVLVMNVAQHLPAMPEAILEWRHNKVEAITAEEGKVFPMPGGSEAPYRLIKVEEDSATIVPILPDGSAGKEIVIKKQSVRGTHRSG